MIHRTELVAQTILGGVLALALLGISATFGLVIVGAVAALSLVGLTAGLIAGVGTEHRSPDVVAVINSSSGKA